MRSLLPISFASLGRREGNGETISVVSLDAKTLTLTATNNKSVRVYHTQLVGGVLLGTAIARLLTRRCGTCLLQD